MLDAVLCEPRQKSCADVRELYFLFCGRECYEIFKSLTAEGAVESHLSKDANSGPRGLS